MITMLVTVLCALLCGFTGGVLYARKPKRRPRFPNGSALRESEPVWGNWNAEIGKAVGGMNR